MNYRHGLMLALFAGLLATNAAVSSNAAEMRIKPAESRMITIAGEPRTIIISRPEVLNVRVLTENKIMIQGIANGDTRVEVLDAEGRKLANLDVIVTDVHDKRTVRLYIAGKRRTYSCAPNCAKVFIPNDDHEALSETASGHLKVQSFYNGIVNQTGGTPPIKSDDQQVEEE